MKSGERENCRVLYQTPGCHPFVKWAGGKSQLIPQIIRLMPARFARYFEPFLGGGAVFFHIASYNRNAFLSDINMDLINAYKAIRNDVEELITALKYHQHEYNKSPKRYYYQLRDKTKGLNRIENAARFITLNKTCYNGLYRVNKKGLFNVPIGRYKNPAICDPVNLRKMSIVLRQSGSYLGVIDYKKILVEKADKDDFVYLDPPFHPISNTANFTSYTNNGFTFEDQKELAIVFNELTRRGCKLLLSNSNTEGIRRLYSDFSHLTELALVNRSINAVGSKRVGHVELLIRNYT
ncbi:MAG TPA: DNA adenine methylase [Nitrososphaeraceae archaeon]|jgi:DNA adenine methylase